MAEEATGRNKNRLPSRYTDQFLSFRNEMDRLFDSFFSGMPALSGFRQAFPPMQGLTPNLDVKETDKQVIVKADLPGIDEKDISLTIQDGILSLRGEKKSEKTSEHENYHIMERSHGLFQRAIRLPDSVDENKAEARFDKGVLTVTLPKRPESVKAQKRIEIRST